jgi:hypothetical protein
VQEKQEGAVWLASYPRSGNTWLRCLLEAYRRNGKLDLNDIRISSSDGGATILRAISPIPLDQLGLNAQLLLRPAALLNLFCRLSSPLWIKTHFANFQPNGMPPLIPEEFTKKAVYIVRDPRSVVLSMAKFFQFSIDAAVDTMEFKDFVIGDNVNFSSQLVSSWTNHVASWTSEQEFPVHVVRYEDMIKDTEKELIEILEFLGEEVDIETVKVAVEATSMAQFKQVEDSKGFQENRSSGGKFFNGGGIRWEDELGLKWIKRIEETHGPVMKALGYLDSEVIKLNSIG